MISKFPFFDIVPEISETNESLKTKMSELRLYCDLLMQQVHTIQEYVHHDGNHSSPSTEVIFNCLKEFLFTHFKFLDYKDVQ